MMRRYLFPLFLGLGGIAILINLGLWQVRRLAWKEALLAAIEARIHAPATDLTAVPQPEPAADQYRPVTAAGRVTGQELLVLSGQQDVGAGYEIIAAFELPDGRRVMLDRGFVPEAARDTPRPATALTVTGNLLWPNEADSYTPAPDPAHHLWFVRDVASMADYLETEPLLVVARTAKGQDPAIIPVPVGTAGIPNDHLQYAITWFSLAVVWAGMTVYFLWRISRRTD